MALTADFSFLPLPPVANTVHLPFPDILNPLGALKDLPGKWVGTGFNTIWRPFFAVPKPQEDEFLELNLTNETIEFTAISGPIPNRGFFQADINMFGLTYMQQISDAVVKQKVGDTMVGAGLHVEPGIWAVVPKTSSPDEPPTVVRMASIPHGTTILAQGTAHVIQGGPTFPPININPIQPGKPVVPFEQQNLSHPSAFRSPPAQIVGITQAMVNNPNSVLANAIKGQVIKSTTVLQVSTRAPRPITGGGTSNTSFLVGGEQGPNADATSVEATFWIELVQGKAGAPDFLQLQYSQQVMLVFDEGIIWPHVTVGTLAKHVPNLTSVRFIDPAIPADVLDRIRSVEPIVAPK